MRTHECTGARSYKKSLFWTPPIKNMAGCRWWHFVRHHFWLMISMWTFYSRPMLLQEQSFICHTHLVDLVSQDYRDTLKKLHTCFRFYNLFSLPQVHTVIHGDYLAFGKKLLIFSSNEMDIQGNTAYSSISVQGEDISLLMFLAWGRSYANSMIPFYMCCFCTLRNLTRGEVFCSDPELIFLTDGASKGVMQLLNIIVRDKQDGVRVLLTKSS